MGLGASRRLHCSRRFFSLMDEVDMEKISYAELVAIFQTPREDHPGRNRRPLPAPPADGFYYTSMSGHRPVRKRHSYTLDTETPGMPGVRRRGGEVGDAKMKKMQKAFWLKHERETLAGEKRDAVVRAALKTKRGKARRQAA
jgi:hypothetical protein